MKEIVFNQIYEAEEFSSLIGFKLALAKQIDEKISLSFVNNHDICCEILICDDGVFKSEFYLFGEERI